MMRAFALPKFQRFVLEMFSQLQGPQNYGFE